MMANSGLIGETHPDLRIANDRQSVQEENARAQPSYVCAPILGSVYCCPSALRRLPAIR
jgi:hypothetical protein